jgi:uncharacterized protein YjbI with pentapeptide repeats
MTRTMDLRTPAEDFLSWVKEYKRLHMKGEMPPPGSRLDLSRMRLETVDFNVLGFEDCNFEQSDLRSADFGASGLYDCSFRNADLSEAWFTKAQVGGCDFRGCSFRGSNLIKAMIHHCDFQGVDFSGAQFARAGFHHCDFRQARLRNLWLKETSLRGCALAGADFTGSWGSVLLRPLNIGSPEAPLWLEGEEVLAWLHSAGASEISGIPMAKRHDLKQ